jgi:hypothetical protein
MIKYRLSTRIFKKLKFSKKKALYRGSSAAYGTKIFVILFKYE